MEPSGLKINKLDYGGDSSDAENNLNDDDVKDLVDALCQNDEFSGPIDLSNNDLSQLVSYIYIFIHFSFSLLSIFKKLLQDLDPRTLPN